ncbi:MAG: class I SAM-dependent methyltransferase [Anaerolineae bacterium]
MNGNATPDMESPYDFDRFVRYYELDHADYTADIPFYQDLARQAGEPVLELGCGAGRVLIPLAEAGVTITGVDLAPRMLARAKEKADAAGISGRVTLVQADMRHLDLPARFRLAFCALNTLMHLEDIEDQIAVLESARRHLVSGGIFAVDLPNPHLSLHHEERTPLTLDKEMVDPETRNRILKLVSYRSDASLQISDITIIYDEVDAAGRLQRTIVPMRMRWIYPYELRLMLEIAGFRLNQLYGSYDLEPFSAGSERMIAVAHVP